MSKTMLEFSNDEKLIAFIDNNDKLKIWDTETSVLKQEYTANINLMASCTCLKWVDYKESTKSPKKAKWNACFIALGTAKGGVALYSYSSAQIEKNLTGKGHQGAVTGIHYNGVNSIFTCGKDCKVIEWDITTGSEIKTIKIGSEIPSTLLVLSKSKRLLTASKQLKLWNLNNSELIRSFTGHQTKINLMAQLVYSGKQYVVTSAETNRFPSLWCLDSEKEKKNNSLVTFSLDDAASFLSVKLVENLLNVCVVTVSGNLLVFKVDMEDPKCKTPVKPKLTIRMVTESTKVVETINIMAAAMQSSSANDSSIKVAYGEMNLLRFETIIPDFTKKEQVLLRANPSRVQTGPNHQKGVSETTKTIQGHVDSSAVEYMNFATTIKRKAVEIPMETRLENLTLGDGKKKPMAKQLIKLLIQGLHSKDAKILKLVFQQQEEDVVALTLSQLPPQYVGTLVNELSIWMQKKGIHVNESIVWLKILIQTHASQLMALGEDEILSSFGVCLGIIEHKVESLKSLSRLRGRLDLLINLVDRNAAQTAQIQNENLLVYEDHSDSDSEIEQDNDSSAPEENWTESEEDDEMDVSE